ncbi:hypothetical protein [Thalassolituus oleivorans]|uniref:hypothetical protein n=1 Tax=Thalassolituus oleivorans TaxID=187493 RepID=UPI0023F05187|nr:hypothetical protein [Thalassolituus oleivorans]
MPLPFILAGAALLAGGYGVKKGFDAKSDFDRAKSLTSEAKDIFDKAKDELDSTRKKTEVVLEKLGKTKLNIWSKSLVPFLESFNKIKNTEVDESDMNQLNSLLEMTPEELSDMNKTAMAMEELAVGGVAALGSGGLAGLAAYGGAQVLATASTGTAISSLSGVAATNATLAWFGGGSLATGGLGMAGGTAVLGGIVAGPVLAIGGMIMASKAEAAKEDAYANLSRAEAAAEQMSSANVATKGIGKRFKEIDAVLLKLDVSFQDALVNFHNLVNKNTDYSSYTTDDKEEVFKVVSYAKTLKNILNTQLLTEEGSLTDASQHVLEEGKNLQFNS